MYTLARVLLEDATQPAPSEFAPVVIDSARRTAGAVDLLEQAGALGYAEAYLYLGRQYQRGNYVEANEDLANAYFAKAAELNNPKAIISYVRYIAEFPKPICQNSDHSLAVQLGRIRGCRSHGGLGQYVRQGCRRNLPPEKPFDGIKKLFPKFRPATTAMRQL